MTTYLRIISIIGLLLFSSVFALTYMAPDSIEASAKAFVKLQIEQEVSEKLQATKTSTLADKARLISEKLDGESQVILENIENKLPERIAAVIASMCGYDCEKKKSITKSVAQSIKEKYKGRLTSIAAAQQKLTDIIKGKYVEVVGKLRTDVRIFLGSNAAMFLILLLLSLLKPTSTKHLMLPAAFLLVATLSAASMYLFGQNWFYTILYNDYMGFGYLAYIGVIFAFLMDVAFNKAVITQQIIGLIGRSISAISPC